MIKRILPVALLGISLISNSGCKNDGGFKTKNGLEYKIVKKGNGKTAMVGDMLSMNIRVRIDDSVLADSRKLNNNQPIQMQLMPPAYRGDWTSGLAMMATGDSGVFRLPVDSLKKATNQPLPPFMKSGKKLIYEVVMVNVKSQAEFKQETAQKSSQQLQADDQKLQAYFSQNNIHPTKTASGVYYTIQKEGSGAQIQKGQTVSIKYVGKTLDGHVFDTNMDSSKHHMEPLTFPVGQNQVIPGMDEGVAALKKGSKATLYIPSSLAYGERSPGAEIPANSILIFEMEIVEVK